jgi:hypothetical protein
VDEAAVFAAIAAQRNVLAKAHANSKAARRATARLPDRRSTVTEPRLCQPSRQWRFSGSFVAR